MRRYVYQFILLTVLCCMPALSSAQQTEGGDSGCSDSSY